LIRQAISCDICGAEKKQTNHWFVASEQGGELRVCGWNSRNKLRAGTKHLCGQTCLHKLVDEFMAGTIAGRITPPTAEVALDSESQTDTDASLTSKAAYPQPEPDTSALTKPAALVPIRPVLAAAAIVVPLQARPPLIEPRPLAPAPRIEDAPNYSSRRWRAEAWERERERELHAVERRPESVPRHRKTF
jgi:hypothetical protein